jgi:hypothetical protein
VCEATTITIGNFQQTGTQASNQKRGSKIERDHHEQGLRVQYRKKMWFMTQRDTLPPA